MAEAEVVVCYVDGLVQCTMENLPGPTEVILNDEVLGSRRTFTYVKTSDTWINVKTVETENFDPRTANSCALRQQRNVHSSLEY